MNPDTTVSTTFRHYPLTLPSDTTLSKNYPTDTVGKAPHLANDNIFVAHLKPTNTIDTR